MKFEKVLGLQQVKAQLKASLFMPQNMISLEIFMKKLLSTLHTWTNDGTLVSFKWLESPKIVHR